MLGKQRDKAMRQKRSRNAGTENAAAKRGQKRKSRHRTGTRGKGGGLECDRHICPPPTETGRRQIVEVATNVFEANNWREEAWSGEKASTTHQKKQEQQR